MYALALALLAAAPDSTGQLVVPTVQLSGVDRAAAPVVTELVLEALLVRHGLPALGPADLADMLSVEQQRQLVGCDEGRCMAEIAGALGGGRVVSGLLGKLGETYVLTLKIIDGQSAQVVARASRSTKSLDELRAVVGPTVDDLLGAKPRAETAVPQLVERRKAVERRASAREVPAFCGALLDGYVAAARGDAGPARLVDARRVLLEDLWLTPYFAELDKKLACVRARDAAVTQALTQQRLGAATADAAERAALGAREWAELSEALNVLVEAYKAGAERERLGTGARAEALPLVLRLARPPARGDTPAAEERWAAAARSLGIALAALAKGDKAAFVARFDRRAERVDPRDVYVDLLRAAERGRLDVCPTWILDPGELAVRTAAQELTRLCVRSVDVETREVKLSDLDAALVRGTWMLLAPEPKKERR